MTRVLLTGASGFVGRSIVAQLKQRDCTLTLPLRPGWQGRLEGLASDCRIVETDDLFAETKDWWLDALNGVDIIIHTAWIATPGIYLASPDNAACLSGSLTLASAAIEAKIQKFVGLGTCAEYRPSDKALTIESPLEPTTLYAAAKIGTYYTLREWFRQAQIPFLWCRLFHLYGEGEDKRRLVAFLHDSLAKGKRVDLTQATQLRDFIEVSQAAARIVSGALGDYQGPANICSGKARSIRSLAEEIADSYGRRELLNFGARPNNPFDPAILFGEPTLFDEPQDNG